MVSKIGNLFFDAFLEGRFLGRFFGYLCKNPHGNHLKKVGYIFRRFGKNRP